MLWNGVHDPEDPNAVFKLAFDKLVIRNELLSPHPRTWLELLGAGNEHQVIADRFVNGFDDPRDYYEWFMVAICSANSSTNTRPPESANPRGLPA